MLFLRPKYKKNTLKITDTELIKDECQSGCYSIAVQWNVIVESGKWRLEIGDGRGNRITINLNYCKVYNVVVSRFPAVSECVHKPLNDCLSDLLPPRLSYLLPSPSIRALYLTREPSRVVVAVTKQRSQRLKMLHRLTGAEEQLSAIGYF